MNFFCTDAGGVIVKAGDCQPEVLDAYAEPGLTVRVGLANPRTQYWDGSSLQTYSPALLAERAKHRQGYRWSITGWIDERSLAQAKADKWNQIKKARATAEAAGFTVGGYAFDSDPESQSQIMLAAQDMSMAGGPTSVNWTLADESVVTISATQFHAVLREMRQHIQAQRDRASARRADIQAAATVAEVDAVSW